MWVTVVWLEQSVGPQVVGPGFIPTLSEECRTGVGQKMEEAGQGEVVETGIDM